MNKIRNLLAILAMLSITGCATFETNSYRVVGSVAISVDGAMQAWGDYVRQGRATAGQESAVKSAHEDYQLAMQGVRIAVDAYREGWGTKDNAQQYVDLVSRIGLRVVDLVQQIRMEQP